MTTLASNRARRRALRRELRTLRKDANYAAFMCSNDYAWADEADRTQAALTNRAPAIQHELYVLDRARHAVSPGITWRLLLLAGLAGVLVGAALGLLR